MWAPGEVVVPEWSQDTPKDDRRAIACKAWFAAGGAWGAAQGPCRILAGPGCCRPSWPTSPNRSARRTSSTADSDHPGNGGPRERAPLPTTSPRPSSWLVARPSTCGHAPRPCCRAWTTTPRLITAGSPRDGYSTPPGRRGTLCTVCPLSTGTAGCRPRCATSSPRRRAGSASAPVWPHRGRRSHHRNVRPHGYRPCSPCTTVRDQSDRLVTDEAEG